ncbi:MAG: DoxX family protein [Acidimicrobiia bacterium]
MSHNQVLWILEWVFGLYFITFGITHYVLPEGLPLIMEWMYDLDTNLHYLACGAEILGGLGLILPAVTRRWPGLVPLAASGLIAVMIGALIWHASRDEIPQMGNNVFLALVLAYVAYGRWKLAPLEARSG